MKLNLTPIIDIVFLLIIFLIVVYQRIDAQNFQIEVPRTSSQNTDNKLEITPATVSIFPNPADSKTIFAVGAEKCPFTAPAQIVNWLTDSIDAETAKKDLKTLRLRIDKTIKFRDSQLALAAAANSKADEMEIATIQDRTSP